MSLKQQIRAEVRKLRNALPCKDELSHRILSHVWELECISRAKTILFYIDVRDEVRTRRELERALISDQRIAVPYCEGDLLVCVELHAMSELQVGSFGILEPAYSIRENLSRIVAPSKIDVVLVPGVAFDQRGGRLGHGKGYYDRLLEQVRPGCIKIGVAFQCQLVEEVPTEPHDVLMDLIVTEQGVITPARPVQK